MATGSRPPHLKSCKPCEFCKHFDGSSECLLYHWPVEGDDTCDSFAPASKRDHVKRAWSAHRRQLAKEK